MTAYGIFFFASLFSLSGIFLYVKRIAPSDLFDPLGVVCRWVSVRSLLCHRKVLTVGNSLLRQYCNPHNFHIKCTWYGYL